MEQATVTTNRSLERGDGPLAGVAAGMADYFGIDPIIIRLGLVTTTLLGGPTVPIVYIAAWLIIPAANKGGDGAQAPVAPAAPWATAPPPPPAPPAPVPPVPAPPAPAPPAPNAPAGVGTAVQDTVETAVSTEADEPATDEAETETETDTENKDEDR